MKKSSEKPAEVNTFKVGDQVIIVNSLYSWIGEIITIKNIAEQGALICDVKNHRDLWLDPNWVRLYTKLDKILA